MRQLSPTILRRRAAGLSTVLLLTAGLSGLLPAAAAARPANCTHESRTPSGAVDPTGLCVSYGYGILPAGRTGPATRNVVARAEGRVPMPFDVYVRSDLAEGIAAGTERPRGTYVFLFGGAFVCGSRADMASPAREAARRGYVVVVPEYPLAGALNAYGYYNPNAPYSQAQVTQRGNNTCANSAAWMTSAGWNQTFIPRLKSRGLEPALQQGQWVVQTLLRTLKSDRSYGVDPKRIFVIGSSAGGALAIRLATGGNQDTMPSGRDPGDSTVAGALSISGPACYPESVKLTTPMLSGTISPSQVPACRVLVDRADPPFIMLQEPRGGTDDPITPSELMLQGCNSINAIGRAQGFGRRCIYEDRPPSSGGYIADGKHADLGWSAWLRLFDVLGAPTNFGQP